uniref:Uncharacterized protein n=1 Tax=Plectus sambesii TaxID=2011161 RepID=A0A914VI76_9BILA
KGPRIRTYYPRLDIPGLLISDELLNKTSLEAKYRMAQGLPPPKDNKVNPFVSVPQQRSGECVSYNCDSYRTDYSTQSAAGEEQTDTESVLNASFDSNVAVVGCRISRAYLDEKDRAKVSTRPSVSSMPQQPQSQTPSSGMGRGFALGNRPTGFGQGNLVFGRKLGPRPG